MLVQWGWWLKKKSWENHFVKEQAPLCKSNFARIITLYSPIIIMHIPRFPKGKRCKLFISRVQVHTHPGEGNNQASSPRQSLTSDKPWKYWSKKCILLFQIPQGLDNWRKECSIPFQCPPRTKACGKPCCSLMKPSSHCRASLGV